MDNNTKKIKRKLNNRIKRNEDEKQRLRKKLKSDIKKKVNRKKDIIFNIGSKGFTLIELIATIAIIAVLSVIAVFTFGKIRENSEDKANYVSREAIMKSAASYADEYYNDSKYWVTDENNDKETFCVPVLDLVNKGFLKQDDIKNVNYKYVVLTRGYSNKTIISEEYDDKGICSGNTGTQKITISLQKKTTSSVSIKGTCYGEGVLNYTFALFKDQDGKEELRNYTTKDNIYTFDGLTSGQTYYLGLKCNYKTAYSSKYAIMEQTIGLTDLSFSTGSVKNDKDSNKIYKEVEIKFEAKNIHPDENAKYYFKVTSSDSVSEETVYACGNGNSPSLTCDSNGVTKLTKGYWYSTKNLNYNKVPLKIYNNSSIYAKIWDGDKFSTNKSFQVTLPTNPYVNINISHKSFKTYNGQYFGEEGNIINYNTNSWMSIPDISWNIYGGYETKSVVYYSNSGNEDDDYTNRRTANIDSKYTCTQSSCTFDKSKIGNNGGMQQLKIVVTNKITRKNTIIYINVNIDKKAPTLTISNSSDGKWTNQNVVVKLSYSDAHSGIDKSTIQWKDNNKNKKWQYESYNETTGDIWSEDGNRIGYYKICDKAGNCTEKSTTIKIDKKAPTCDWSGESTTWINSDRTIKVMGKDSGSGTSSSKSWTIKETTKTKDLSYAIKDNAGNETICTKKTNVYVDKTKPVCTFYNIKDFRKTDTEDITFTCNDTMSGIVSKKLSSSNFDLKNISITKISSPESITNGYKYTITIKAGTVGDDSYIGIKSNIIYDNAGNGNEVKKSNIFKVLPNTYTVTYNSNGCGNDCNPKTKTVTYGEKYGELCTINKTGYKFSGWYTATNGGTKITFSSTYNIESDQTLYARCSAKTVNVTFSKNDGSGETATQSFTYGASGNRFGYNTDGSYKWGSSGQFGSWDRTGYTLLGWSTNSNASSATYSTYSGVADGWINSNSPSITLYAVWKENAQTINGYRCSGSDLYYITTCGLGTGICNYTHKNDYERNGTVVRSKLNYNLSSCSNYQVNNSSTYTKTINRALSLVSSSNTIKIINDNNDSSSATVSKNVTIDTNGKTVTRTSTINVNSGYTLTMNGTGGILNTSSRIFSVSGTLKIQGGTYETTGSSGNVDAVYLNDSGNIVLEDINRINLWSDYGCGAAIESNSSNAINVNATNGGIYLYGYCYGIRAPKANVSVSSSYTNSVSGVYNYIHGELGYAIAGKNIYFGTEYNKQTTSTAYYPQARSNNYMTNSTYRMAVLSASGNIYFRSGNIYSDFKAGTYQSDWDKPTYYGPGDTYKSVDIGSLITNKKVISPSGYTVKYFTSSSLSGNVIALRIVKN